MVEYVLHQPDLLGPFEYADRQYVPRQIVREPRWQKCTERTAVALQEPTPAKSKPMSWNFLERLIRFILSWNPSFLFRKNMMHVKSPPVSEANDSKSLSATRPYHRYCRPCRHGTKATKVRVPLVTCLAARYYLRGSGK